MMQPRRRGVRVGRNAENSWLNISPRTFSAPPRLHLSWRLHCFCIAHFLTDALGRVSLHRRFVFPSLFPQRRHIMAADNRGVAYIEPGVVEVKNIDFPKLWDP